MSDHRYRLFPAWLDAAIRRNADDLESAHLQGDYYRSPCWRLAGELRGHPSFSSFTGFDMANALDRVIEWNRLPDADSYDKPVSARDSLIEAWEWQVEHDVAPLQLSVAPEEALHLAECHPLEGPQVPPKYALTIGVNYWFGKLRGGPYWLAIDTLADLLAISSSTASFHMKWAQRASLIEVIKDYPRHTRRARVYSWIGQVEYAPQDV